MIMTTIIWIIVSKNSVIAIFPFQNITWYDILEKRSG